MIIVGTDGTVMVTDGDDVIGDLAVMRRLEESE